MSFQFQSAVFYGVGVRSFAHVGGQIESVEGVSSSVVVIVDDQSSVAVVHVHGLVQQAQDFCISAPVSKVWGKGCFMGEGLIVGGQGQVVEAKVLEVERIFSTAAVESAVGDQSQENSSGQLPDDEVFSVEGPSACWDDKSRDDAPPQRICGRDVFLKLFDVCQAHVGVDFDVSYE